MNAVASCSLSKKIENSRAHIYTRGKIILVHNMQNRFYPNLQWGTFTANTQTLYDHTFPRPSPFPITTFTPRARKRNLITDETQRHNSPYRRPVVQMNLNIVTFAFLLQNYESDVVNRKLRFQKNSMSASERPECISTEVVNSKRFINRKIFSPRKNLPAIAGLLQQQKSFIEVISYSVR